MLMQLRIISYSEEEICHHNKNVNVAWRKKCRKMVSRKLSLFNKMQGEIYQIDMYGLLSHPVLVSVSDSMDRYYLMTTTSV